MRYILGFTNGRKHYFKLFSVFQDVQAPETSPELAKQSNLGMGVIETRPQI
jgi:hypothetical protein